MSVTTGHRGIIVTTAPTPQTPKPAPAQYFPIDSVMCLLWHLSNDRVARESAADLRCTGSTP
jgi:hypothetical protein